MRLCGRSLLFPGAAWVFMIVCWSPRPWNMSRWGVERSDEKSGSRKVYSDPRSCFLTWKVRVGVEPRHAGARKRRPKPLRVDSDPQTIFLDWLRVLEIFGMTLAIPETLSWIGSRRWIPRDGWSPESGGPISHACEGGIAGNCHPSNSVGVTVAIGAPAKYFRQHIPDTNHEQFATVHARR